MTRRGWPAESDQYPGQMAGAGHLQPGVMWVVDRVQARGDVGVQTVSDLVEVGEDAGRVRLRLARVGVAVRRRPMV